MTRATETNCLAKTRFGRFVNGSFYKIEPQHRDAIAKDLEKLGYTVVERADLKFW